MTSCITLTMDRYSMKRYGLQITGKSARGRGVSAWSTSKTVKSFDAVSEYSAMSSSTVPKTKENLTQTSQHQTHISRSNEDVGQSEFPKTIPSDIKETNNVHDESPSKPSQPSRVQKYEIQQIPDENRIWSAIDKIVERSFREIQLSGDVLDTEKKRSRRSWGNREEDSDDDSKKKNQSFRHLLEANNSENDDDILNLQPRPRSPNDQARHTNRSRRSHPTQGCRTKINVSERKLKRRNSNIGSTRIIETNASKNNSIEKQESESSSHSVVQPPSHRCSSPTLVTSAPANTLETKMKRRGSSTGTMRIIEATVSKDYLIEKQESKSSADHVVLSSSQRRASLSMGTSEPVVTSRRMSCPMVSSFVDSNAHPVTRRTSIKEVKSIEKYRWTRRMSGLTAEVDANEHEIDKRYKKLTTNPKDSLRKIDAEQSTAIFDIDEYVDPVEMAQSALSSFELFE